MSEVREHNYDRDYDLDLDNRHDKLDLNRLVKMILMNRLAN